MSFISTRDGGGGKEKSILRWNDMSNDIKYMYIGSSLNVRDEYVTTTTFSTECNSFEILLQNENRPRSAYVYCMLLHPRTLFLYNNINISNNLSRYILLRTSYIHLFVYIVT